MKKFENTGLVENLKWSGCARIFTVKEKRYTIKKVIKDQLISEPDLALDMSYCLDKFFWVQIELERNSLIQKHNINSKHKKCLNFTKKYIHQPEGFYNKVISADETKFTIFGLICLNKSQYNFQTKKLKPTVKQGRRSVMVWGSTAASRAI